MEKEICLPKSWYDLNLNQFNRLNKLQSKSQDIDPADFGVEFLHIVTNIDKEIIKEFNVDTLLKLSNETQKFISIPLQPITNVKIFNIEGVDFSYDLENLSHKQMLDLNSYIIKDGDVWEYAHEICAILIRPLVRNGLFSFKKQNYSKENLSINSKIFKMMIQ
jgi:hypothetical protein